LTIASTGSTSLDRHRRPGRLQAEESAQRGTVLVLLVHEARVLLEEPVLPRARRVLQLEDRVGVEQVVLAVAAPLVFAARLELLRPDGCRPNARSWRSRTSSAITSMPRRRPATWCA
jgi:hypothetical protein